MFYRVVMQGRTVGGADIAVVKREFVRVTGLPVRVADDMFGGMPKVIKRKAEQADAERIAATLRAIGAAATVERETPGTADDEAEDEGIEIIANPLSGPPTVAPGITPQDAPAPAKKWPRWMGHLRENVPVLLGLLALLGAAVYFGPEASDYLATLRKPANPPAPKAAASASAEQSAAGQSLTFNVTLLHGPWRCVDQRTGLGVYWSYNADGGLIFHGDVLSDRAAPPGTTAPTAWRLDSGKLLHQHPDGEVETFKVGFLSLARLRYVGERGLEVECRRP
ncbi:MAG: ribosomal protein L7/L12 [Burkholderiales bacterium]